MKTFEQFMKNGGCPFCGKHTHLDYTSINIDGSIADQKADCFNCGGRWWEIYRMIGYEFTTYQDEHIFVGREDEQL